MYFETPYLTQLIFGQVVNRLVVVALGGPCGACLLAYLSAPGLCFRKWRLVFGAAYSCQTSLSCFCHFFGLGEYHWSDWTRGVALGSDAQGGAGLPF